MKTLSLLSGIVIMTIILVPGCNRKSDQIQEDIDAINNLYEQYLKYAEAGDLDGFMTCWDDNALRSEPGKPTIVGKEAIRENFREIYEAAEYKFTPYGERIMEVMGDYAFGYTTATLTTIPTDGSDTLQMDIKVLSIMKNQPDGSWKIYIDNINFHPTLIEDTIPDALKEDNPYY